MQDLANGHLDVKALGEAANGDENTIVTTRTGNTYPSAERAINIMFQNGGLPAKPFTTKAKMETEGASLADGAMAMVYNETANNGLYLKTTGAWVKPNYDPHQFAALITNKLKYSLVGNYPLPVTYRASTSVKPYELNTYVTVPQTDSTRKISIIDVRNVNEVLIKKAKTVTTASDEWRWIATDEWITKALGASDFTGEGVFKLPLGTVFLVRNANLKGSIDEDVEVVTLSGSGRSFKDIESTIYNESIYKTEVAYDVFNGATVNTNPANPALLSAGTDRAYLVINVVNIKTLVIENGKSKESGLDIAFTDASGNRILITKSTGNGSYDVPKNAVHAYRTHTFPPNHNYVENEDIKFYSLLSFKDEVLERIDEFQYTENAEYKIINGATVNTNPANPALLSAGADRAYFKISVDGAKRLTIKDGKNKESGLDIAFTDASGNRILITKSTGNGSYDVPSGAVHAYRTHTFPPNHNYVENEGINITLEASVRGTLTKLNTAIKDIKNRLYSDSTARSQEIIKSSGMPVFKLSSFSGANSQAKIDEAVKYIKSVGKGILDLESGEHVMTKALVLPSNFWLYLNDATLRLADGTFDNIIRNDGIIPNPDPYQPSETINENSNIRVFGNGSARSTLSGCIAPYKAANPVTGVVETWTDDNYGWRTIGIMFANVKDFKVHDFYMENLQAWAICVGHGADDFDIHDIDFDNRELNGDGVHMINGCTNGRISRLGGYTLDDMCAITATKNFVVNHPHKQYVYPMAVGGWGDRPEGIDVSDIQISDIKGAGKNQGVRILVNGGAKCHDIIINNVTDNGTAGFSNHLIIVGTGWGSVSGWGDIYNIYINNVESNHSTNTLYLDARIQNLYINNVRQNKVNGFNITFTGAYEGQNVHITNSDM